MKQTAHPFTSVSRRPGTGRWGRVVRYLASTTSTNDEALRDAAGGAPSGLVVVADAQTRGRGRHGRSWAAAAGENLLASWVLRPTVGPGSWPWIPLAAALAVADVVEARVGSAGVGVKWPNDVRVRGRKVAGILAESRLDAGGSGFVVLGIGLNVNQDRFPPELSESATSLFQVTGKRADRAAVLADLCDRLESRVSAIAEEPGALAGDYRARLEGVGCEVQLRTPGAMDAVSGLMHGIDDRGALVLELDGRLRTFQAGEVTLRPASMEHPASPERPASMEHPASPERPASTEVASEAEPWRENESSS